MPPRVDGAPTYRPAVPHLSTYLPTRRRDIVPNSQPPPITLLISTPEQAGAAASRREVFADEDCRSRAYIWMRGLVQTESELVVLLAIVKRERETDDVMCNFLSHLAYSRDA